MSALAWEKGKAIAVKLEQAFAFDLQWCDNRNLGGHQLVTEAVFFVDGGVGPALGPVKLGDQKTAIFHCDLINAVLVAVQRQQAAGWQKVEAFDSAENQVRGELRIRCVHNLL